jgi:hypothetical protein
MYPECAMLMLPLGIKLGAIQNVRVLIVGNHAQKHGFSWLNHVQEPWDNQEQCPRPRASIFQQILRWSYVGSPLPTSSIPIDMPESFQVPAPSDSLPDPERHPVKDGDRSRQQGRAPRKRWPSEHEAATRAAATPQVQDAVPQALHSITQQEDGPSLLASISAYHPPSARPPSNLAERLLSRLLTPSIWGYPPWLIGPSVLGIFTLIRWFGAVLTGMELLGRIAWAVVVSACTPGGQGDGSGQGEVLLPFLPSQSAFL